MRAVLGERPWELDPILVSMPFNEDAFQLKNLQLKAGSSAPQESLPKDGKLCFAIEWDDGVVHPHPPITRALRETKAKLEAAGHTVIDWKPYDHLRAYDIIGRIYTADGGEDIRRSCQQGGEPVMYNLMADGKEQKHLSTFESWQVNQEKSAYRKEYLDYWGATKDQTGTGRAVDAIIAPVSSWASCKHDLDDYVGYTTQWNLLDRPCVVFPVSHVDAEKDKKIKLENPYTGLGEGVDQEYWDRCKCHKPPPYLFLSLLRCTRSSGLLMSYFLLSVLGMTDDPEEWSGLPINLQVVGKRLQDEELLGIAKVIRDAGATLH